MRSPRKGLSSCSTRHICCRQADKPECRITPITTIMKSNEPTKTKSKMKKTMRFLSMTALALVGAVITGCSSDDNFIEQQPENSGKVTTLKTTISFDDGATTRALTSGGVKTFAVGDQVAIVFEDGKSRTWTALSNALTAGDIRNSGKTADITVDIFSQLGTTQANNGAVRLIYPANMAKTFSGTSDAINNDNTIDFTKLNAQDGTLDNLGSSIDLCTFDGNFTATGELPTSITLTNKLAVCALTLKNSDGSSTLTSGLTEVTVSDGSNTYTVAPTSGTFGEDVIYVAIRPVTAALEYTATDGTNNYTKTATSREYAAGNFYNLGLRMAEAAPALNLTSPAVGQVIGDDGKNYDYASLPGGVTAVAKICYVSGSNGLALALADEGEMNWSTAISTCAAHTPAFTGGTWKLATKDEWTNMITAAGSYTALRDGFSSVGGSNLQSSGWALYWSSTGDSDNAWLYNFSGGSSGGKWDEGTKYDEVYVRACLAF